MGYKTTAELKIKKQEKLSKQQFRDAKNSIRVVGRIPEKEEKTGGTGEMKVFEALAEKKKFTDSDGIEKVWALHIDEVTAKPCQKKIALEHLGPENFHHEKAKGQHEEGRLDEDNIQIVSFAYHFKIHNGQTLRLKYPN